MKTQQDKPVARVQPKTATGSGGSGKPPATAKTAAPGASKSTLPARVKKAAGRVEKDMGVAERVPNKALPGAAKAASAAKPGILSRVANGIRGVVRAGKGKAGPLGLFLTGAALSMEAGRAVDNAIAASRSKSKSEGSSGRSGRNARNIKSTAAAAKAPAATKAAEAPKPKAAATPSASKGSVQTKGGNYPVYPKKSSQAASFRSAFASARKAGKKTFTWEGRLYNTKLKGE